MLAYFDVIDLVKRVCEENGESISTKQAKRFIKQGAFRIDGVKIEDPDTFIRQDFFKKERVMNIGKHRWLRTKAMED